MRKLLVLAAAFVGATPWLSLVRAQQPAPAPVQAATPAPAETASGSKVWIGRYAEFEEFLKTARIVKTNDVQVGVTHPKHVFFEPGGLANGAVLKDLPAGIQGGFWEAYKSEIAAYRLDRILGLNMVPPTVERRVGPDLSSLQLWVENCKVLKQVDQKQCPRPMQWAKQVCRQRAFDNLVANIDRNEGNLLVDPEWNLILIDHSRAFATNTMPFMKEMTRIDREFYTRLKALDEETLMRELKPWVLGGGNIKDLLKRRDKIVAHFDQLAKEKTEASVFPF